MVNCVRSVCLSLCFIVGCASAKFSKGSSGRLRLCLAMQMPRKRLLLVVLLFVLAVSGTWLIYGKRSWEKTPPGGRVKGPDTVTCRDVLKGMTKGKWVPRKVQPKERELIDAFLLSARSGHHLPATLQRPDGLCGNVTFDWLKNKYHDLLWFRALCDSKGTNSCCRDGRCQNLPMEQCRCDTCYDLRQDVDAELATWEAHDSACRMPPLSRDQICEVIGNSHVIFAGDSFVRHVYTALLMVMRDLMYGALLPAVSEEIRRQCVNLYMFTEKICRIHLLRTASLCNGTAHISFFEYLGTAQGLDFVKIIQNKTHTNRTIVIAGIGIHNDYNAEAVWQLYLQPGLMAKGNADWPKLLWLSPHCPGLLKTPRVPQQSRDYVMSFNDIIGARLMARGVPVLDTWEMTDGVTSFDGAHYGLGVNVEKVKVIVRYLQELSAKGKW